MKITIDRFKLTNFKGLRDYSAVLNGRSVAFYGRNQSGKTTLWDAWLWLLFDMDSRGFKGADAAKTTDGSGFVHQIENTVEFWVKIDGEERHLVKTLRENWIKPRGRSEAVYQGNTCVWSIDDLPKTAGEWQAWVKSLADPEIFKLCSDPTYFMALHWTKRLEMLVKLVGAPAELDIAGEDPALLRYLEDRGKLTDAEYKKQTQNRIAGLNDELAALPVRIDEQIRSIPAERDWTGLENEAKILTEDKESLNAQLFDSQEAVKGITRLYTDLQAAKDELKSYIAAAEWKDHQKGVKAVEKRNELEAKVKAAERDIANRKATLDGAKDSAEVTAKAVERLREEYKLAAAEAPQITYMSPSAEDLTCPACGQDLPADQRIEMEAAAKTNYERRLKDWQDRKAARLADLKLQGQKAADRASIQRAFAKDQAAELAEAEEELAKLKAEHEAAKQEVYGAAALIFPNHAEDPETAPMKAKIAELEAKVANVSTDSRPAEIRGKIAQIEDRLRAIDRELAGRDNAAKAKQRVEELRERLAEIGAKKTELEQQLIAGESWSLRKTEALAERINARFTQVGFKLTSEQINGGITEACEPVVNGTTFYKANTAGQINAGLEIVQAFSEDNGLFVPVYVDHVESLNRVYPISSQIIKLVVSDDNQLRLEA